MGKNLLNRVLGKFGHAIQRTDAVSNRPKHFTLFQYKKNDGSFDYEKYRRIQQEGNLKKLDHTWVIEENIKFLGDYLKKTVNPIEFGICHGTRRGNEQKWFREYLQCGVIGTEISESATRFPHTVQWDFHVPNPEWNGKADFIYSNSFDHSYDPEGCLNTWIETLRIGGVCILEHSNLHAPEGANELDPFGAEIEVMPYLITKWGKGSYHVREILDAPEKKPTLKTLGFIVIERAR